MEQKAHFHFAPFIIYTSIITLGPTVCIVSLGLYSGFDPVPPWIDTKDFQFKNCVMRADEQI
jgi:hypothetical protein